MACHISDEDIRAAREAAARIDFNWEDGVGSKPGVEIWRVENKRTENDHPDFGIAAWPTKQYGQFHRGDSYIVLLTTKDDAAGGEKLLHDIFFWIGSESSQDEYGVAAYKAVGKKCIKVQNSDIIISYDTAHTHQLIQYVPLF